MPDRIMPEEKFEKSEHEDPPYVDDSPDEPTAPTLPQADDDVKNDAVPED